MRCSLSVDTIFASILNHFVAVRPQYWKRQLAHQLTSESSHFAGSDCAVPEIHQEWHLFRGWFRGLRVRRFNRICDGLCIRPFRKVINYPANKENQCIPTVLCKQGRGTVKDLLSLSNVEGKLYRGTAILWMGAIRHGNNNDFRNQENVYISGRTNPAL